MAEKLINFEKLKKNKKTHRFQLFQACSPDDWPDALDPLIIGLVANK